MILIYNPAHRSRCIRLGYNQALESVIDKNEEAKQANNSEFDYFFGRVFLQDIKKRGLMPPEIAKIYTKDDEVFKMYTQPGAVELAIEQHDKEVN